MGQARRALHHWPRVSRLKDGGVHIHGRCMSVGRWVLIHRLGRLLVLGLGVATIMVATLPAWADGQGWFDWLVRDLHRWIYTRTDLLALEHEWGVASAPGDADYALAIGGALVVLLAKPLGSLIAGIAGRLLKCCLANRIDIVVTPEMVVVARWWGAWRLPRSSDADSLQVRVVPAEDYYSAHSRTALNEKGFAPNGPILHPPAVVEIAHRLRRYKVIMARREDEAEAIVTRCNEALMDTNPSFSAPESVFAKRSSYARVP